MSIFVVDASVVIKWFVPEVYSDAARRLLAYDHQYFAPDLLFAEIANAVWKKVSRGDLSSRDGERLMVDLDAIAVETVACRALASDAFLLASATGSSVYDAMYLTLAVRLGTRMITADERLVAALASMALATHIQSVQDFRGT